MSKPSRWIFPILMMLSPITIATVFVLVKNPDELRPRTRSSSILGRQGEWVTRPDGRRVCQLAADLRINETIGPAFCTNWQEPMPAIGQTVEGWIRSNQGGYQIMIEGSWRP